MPDTNGNSAVLDAIEATRREVEGLREVTITPEQVRQMIADADAERRQSNGSSRGYSPGDTRVVSEPEQYGPRGERSWFADLFAASMKNDGTAGDRLRRQSEIAIRDLGSTDGTGGNFVPPIYMQDEFLTLARAGRPFANAVSSAPLPPNTDSINIPKVVTGTATSTQADNAPVQETDATDALINVPVRTVAGQQDVSRQLFDRSVPGVDQILLADLAADYGTKLDVQCLAGNGTAPNARGVLNVVGVNAVSYTDGTPTVAEVYPKFADAIQRIHTLRFLPPSLIVMHPRRWGWLLGSVDTTGRPLVSAEAPQNAIARFDRVASENIVGQIQGVPVMVDASIPTTTNTDQDPIIILRVEDAWLFEEDQPNQATYFEVLSGTLGVRLQVWGYFAFSAERYPAATSVITGTGLNPPTF